LYAIGSGVDDGGKEARSCGHTGIDGESEEGRGSMERKNGGFKRCLKKKSLYDSLHLAHRSM
jgi:hypothetical protein